MSTKVKQFYAVVLSIIILLSIILLILINPLKAATYYYISGPINSLSSWKTGSNGTGTSPTSFTGGNTFIIWNSLSSNISPTLTGVWNFGGTRTTVLQIGMPTGSATLTIAGGTLNLQGNAILRVGATTGTISKQLIIASNGILNITSGATTPLRVYNNATLTIASSTFPVSGDVALNTGSYVEWAQTTGTTTIWQRTYQNMIISGGGVKRHNGTGTLRVVGQLRMLSGALLMSNNTGATLRLSGTITGSAPIQTSNSNLTIDGAGAFGTIYFANGNTAMSIRNLTINRTSLGQITLGTNLTVNGTTNFSNGVINLNNNTLTLNGAITLPATTTNGYFIGSRNSSIVIGGTGNITNNLLMSTTTLTTSSLANLTMNRNNRTLTIGNPLRIWGELSATTGTINTNGNVTIKADATQKGRIAPIGTNADIAGNITMEVFANGGSTGWTLLGIAGVQSQSFTSWSDDFPITCPTCPISSTFTSIYEYCETCATNNYSASTHYVPMSSINNSITVGKGYWVYLGNTTYTTNNIIIDATGAPVKKNFGTISLTRTGPATIQNGWNLIANPYPSPISFAKLLSSIGTGSTSIDKTIYVWNPDLNGGNGDYAIYNTTTGSIPLVSSGGINDNIPTGQGFFVHVSNAITLSPNENWKTTTNNQNNLLRSIQKNNSTQSVNNYPPSMFILEMKGPNNYDVWTGIAQNLNATSNFDDLYDAIQVGSVYPAPQLMTVLNGMEYKLNNIPIVNGTFTMEVKAITGVSGTYSIIPINLSSFSNGACISLYDKFTGNTHNLSNGAYVFNLSDTTTVPRFILSITNNSITTSANILQQPVCTNDLTGIATVNISGSSFPYILTFKDNNGNILQTDTISSNSFTYTSLSAGNYFVEVSNSSSCASSVQNILVTPTNSILPISAFNLITNDTLPLDFSQPIVATNQSTNTSNIEWTLIGDGYTTTSNTFSYMPDAEGDYILQLTAYNACGDTSVQQIPITIIPGPNSPSPFGYGPNGVPMFTSKTTNVSENTSIKEPEIFISKDDVGYFIETKNINQFDVQVSDILGRILFKENNISGTAKYYLKNISADNEWILVSIIYDNKMTSRKIFFTK
ncbi:MAG: hypothetical protein AB1304_00910 [Bacteroidota bacterium]